jgi:hypothetical protein
LTAGWVHVIVAVARRPRLWAAALGQARRLAAPGWWRHAPFLPLPAPDYIRFRAVTQYGDPDHRPEPADVLDYLAWCREWHGHT